MSNNTTTENNGLCPTCINSIHCPTWAEWKCVLQKKRIYGYKTMTDCKFYRKRPGWFNESPCQCEDCLKNPELAKDQEE